VTVGKATQGGSYVQAQVVFGGYPVDPRLPAWRNRVRPRRDSGKPQGSVFVRMTGPVM